MTEKTTEVKPIIARDDQEGRYLDDGTCHAEGCPCEDCFDAYRARIMAAWVELGDLNQRDLASMFEQRFDGQIWPEQYRFDGRRGRWMEFVSRRETPWAGQWRPAQAMFDAVGGLIATLCGDSKSDAARWGKLAVYKDVLALAREHLTIDQWDAWGEVLGLPNGDIWFLEKGWGEPNNHRLPITKQTGVDPDEYQSPRTCRPSCTCLWHSFLFDVTGGDDDMMLALQTSVGASLFGGNRDHRLNCIVGDGGTGKSLFLNTIRAALGDYGGTMPASVLASKGNDHPTGLAGVVDKRFVTVPEVSGGMWKEETLKAISGGDVISVRYMRQDFFEVKPECTLWVSTNEPPALSTVDNAIRRRIRIWPFTHKPKDVDPRLGDKLQEPAMLGKVLQWALSGAERYARLNGELVEDCDAVIEATSDYFTDVDTIGGWLASSTTPSHIPEYDTSASAAFKHYVTWCESEGQRPTSRTAWGVSMGRRVKRRRTGRGQFYAIELDDGGDVGECRVVQGSNANPTSITDPKSATKQGSF